MTDPRRLTDDALIESVSALAAVTRETIADLIAHLVELERRNLHLACGFKSLFGYCRHVLHCSEAAAYDRMQAAHVARRFPVVLAMLGEGLLHLTAVRLLAPRLDDENHLALLGGAIHKSGREVRALLARWFPRPDVADSVRKLPTETPLSAGRYEFRFTGDEELKDLLQEARELLSHSMPGGDMAAIVKRGLRLVVAEARRSRHAATEQPRAPRPIAEDSRGIPAYVQRAVWDRDGGQCSFAGRGRRCEERSFLEYHHLTPWIVGGHPSVENIALRCRAHNQYESKVYFEPMRRAMAGAG